MLLPTWLCEEESWSELLEDALVGLVEHLPKGSESFAKTAISGLVDVLAQWGPHLLWLAVGAAAAGVVVLVYAAAQPRAFAARAAPEESRL